MAYFINNRNNGTSTFLKKASEEFALLDFVTINGSGFAVPGGTGKIVGVCNEVISSTDADYAVARKLNLSEATYNDELVINVATGTATQALVGTEVDIDNTDKGSVDVTASTNKQILVTGIINDSTITGKIVSAA